MDSSIHVIRACFAAFGMPLDDLTDEEVEQGVIRTGTLLASTGVTMEQAANGFHRLANLDLTPPAPPPVS